MLAICWCIVGTLCGKCEFSSLVSLFGLKKPWKSAQARAHGAPSDCVHVLTDWYSLALFKTSWKEDGAADLHPAHRNPAGCQDCTLKRNLVKQMLSGEQISALAMGLMLPST